MCVWYESRKKEIQLQHVDVGILLLHFVPSQWRLAYSFTVGTSISKFNFNMERWCFLLKYNSFSKCCIIISRFGVGIAIFHSTMPDRHIFRFKRTYNQTFRFVHSHIVAVPKYISNFVLSFIVIMCANGIWYFFLFCGVGGLFNT